MKSIHCFFVVSALFLSISVPAQEVTDINTLLTRLSENHLGSVLDVFTIDELARIKEHFASTTRTVLDQDQNKNPLLERRYASSQVVVPVRVVSIDPEDLSSLIDFGPSTITEFEGAGYVRGNPVNQAGIVDNTNRLYIRGINNNNLMFQGTISNVPTGEVITGLEVRPGRTDQLFGISTNGTNSSHLLLINQNTLEAEVVGGNNGIVAPVSLARDGNNNLITLDIDTDQVYGINAVSGVVNVIGNVGYDANFGQGMTYDEGSGKVISAAYNAMVGDSELREINPTTGVSISLGTINPSQINQFGWISYYDDDTLSTESNPLNGFDFYPNPADEAIHMQATSVIQKVTIYDLRGSRLIQQSLNATQGRLSVAQLSTGMYILKIESQGETGSYKLIKK